MVHPEERQIETFFKDVITSNVIFALNQLSSIRTDKAGHSQRHLREIQLYVLFPATRCVTKSISRRD